MARPRLIVSLAVLLAWVLAPMAVGATDRYFRDFKAISPGGAYRFEATSPDNKTPDGRPRPFARNFTCTLADTARNTLLWTYKQGESEASPIAAWIDDSGWTVVRTGLDELMCFDLKGVRTGMVDILEQFPQDETERFVHMTSAGPMWADASRWYFMETGDGLHFVVRAHWGRRVILRVADGSIVKDVGAVTNLCRNAEIGWVLDTLRSLGPRFVDVTEEDSKKADFHQLVWALNDAVTLAGRERLKEAVPLLREIEKSKYAGECSTIPVYFGDVRLPEGAVDPFSYCTYTIRARGKQALRRMGETPSDLPTTAFRKEAPDFQGDWVIVTLSEPRRVGLTRIKPGMSPIEVLQLVDGPDNVANGREIAWEYHTDDRDAATVRVTWEKGPPPTVKEIKRVRPPTWVGSDEPF